MWQLSFGNNGRFNTAVGSCSGKALGIGESNTAIGFESLCSNYDGNSNTMVGAFTGQSISGTNLNTAVGFFSLGSNVTGIANTALGACTLRNMTGGYNTAVGFYSMYAANTGAFNVALGMEAGCAITSGCCNVVIGPCTQVASATGSCQLSIGFGAGQNWLTGTSTKAIRPGAGIIDCTGSCGTPGQILVSNGNAICWSSATGAIATPTAAGVVLGCTTANTAALGCSALALSSGTFNTALGACAGDAITTGSRNVIIGPEAEVASATGSCQLAIGFNATNNWLTGDSSKHIQPGAGIRDCTGSLGTSSQVLTSTGSAIQWAGVASSLPGLEIIPAGLQSAWGATTTAPVTGGGWYGYYLRQIGQKYYQISIAVGVDSFTSAGSGDYLFTLPNSLAFNASTTFFQQEYTGSVGAANFAFVRYLVPGSGAITNLSTANQVIGASVYDGTRFRVVLDNYRAWGSSFYPVSNNLRVSLTFQFTTN
jgi:hypothetical protein